MHWADDSREAPFQWGRRVNTGEWEERMSRLGIVRGQFQWGRRVNTAECRPPGAQLTRQCTT